MIVVFGGTGELGRELVRLLAAGGDPVRVASRHAMPVAGAESIVADVRDREAVARAVAGARVVVLAAHGFGTTGGDPRSVDAGGNRHVIDAAREAGVEHVVLISVYGAAADHPIELFRCKYAAETALRASGLAFTIVRPTAFMETWVRLLGMPLRERGKTVVFGSGDRPINFVSARDVAAVAARAIADPSLRGATIELAGPDDLSLDQLLDTYEAVTGAHGARKHLSLGMMRIAAAVTRVVRPSVARHIRAAIVMNTRDMTAAANIERGPTTLAQAIRRDHV